MLSLEIVEVGHQYLLTKVLASAPTDLSRIDFKDIENKKAAFEIKDLGAGEKDDKKSGTKVGIEGSVTFPKDRNTPPKPDGK